MNNRFGNISISGDETPETPKKSPAKSPAPAEHKQPQRSRKRKSRSGKPLSSTTKLVLWLVVLPAFILGLYSFAGFVLFPQYIGEKTPLVLQNNYGIGSSIGSVTFNPFTFSLEVNDVAIADQSEKNSASPLLHIKSIKGVLSPFELIRTNLAIKHMAIDEPMLSLIRFSENEYNFSKYLSPDQLKNQDDFLHFADLPFLYSINNIAITNGEILFIDKPSGKNHQVTKVEIGIPTLANFDYHTAITVKSDFSAELNGSPLKINSESGTEGNGLTIDLNQIELADYAQYLPVDLPIRIHSGKTDGKLNFAFDQDKKLAIDYQLDIENLTGDTNDEAIHIEMPKSQFIGSYRPMAGSLSLENAYLKDPSVRTSGSFSLASLDSLLPKRLNDNSANAKAPLSVHRLLINGGTFEGKNQKERLAIKDIEFSLQDFNTPVGSTDQLNTGTFSFKGQNEDQGSISWQGSFTEKSGMTGDFQLIHFRGKDLCKFIWKDSLRCDAADTEMKGIFSISRQKETKESTNLFFSVDESSINFDAPEISSASTKFSASQLLAEDFSYEAGQEKIGKLTVKNIEITVADQAVADLLTPITDNNSIQIQAMDISGKATITNQNKQKPLILNKLFFSSKIDAKDATTHNIAFKAYTAAEGEIRADGTATLSPLAITVSVSFNNIDTRELFPLLTNNPVAYSSEAVISGKGQYTYPQSGFFGSIECGPAKILSGARALGNWKKAEFSSIIYKSNPYSLRVKETSLTEPAFFFDRKTNSKITPDRFAEVLTTLLPVKNLPKNTSKYKYPFYEFETIEIKNGTLIPMPISQTQSDEYTQIAGTITNSRFPTEGKESVFSFQAKRQDTQLKISGSGVFFQSPSNGSYTLSFTNPNLDSIVPAVHDAGLNINKSEIQGQVKAEWFNGKGIYNFDLTTGNVVPYDKDSSAALTLALLYKNSPRFTVQFEHNQNTQAENMPLHQMVLDFLKRNQLKTQISPFLLTPDFTDLVDINNISFRNGSNELTSEAIEWLTRLGVFLQSYPLVKLQLLPILSDADRAALQKVQEDIEAQRVEKENEIRYQEWQKANLEISRKREEIAAQKSEEAFIEEDLNAPELAPFTPLAPKPVRVSVVELNELAYQRLKEVADFLEQSLHVNPAQLERVNQVLRNNQGDNGVTLRYSTRFKNPDA